MNFVSAVKGARTEDSLFEDKAEPLPLLDHQLPDVRGEGWNMLAAEFWLNLITSNVRRSQAGKWNMKTGREPDSPGYLNLVEDTTEKLGGPEDSSREILAPEASPRGLAGPGRGPIGTALFHCLAKWSSYAAVCFKRWEQSLRSFWQVWVSHSRNPKS